MDQRFDGFSVSMYLDDEGAWLAHFAELPDISAFGQTPEAALAQLSVAWEAMKEVYRDKGMKIPVAPARKKYSGSFNIRIDKSLHRALAIEAAREGVSLNAIVAKKLSRSAKLH